MMLMEQFEKGLNRYLQRTFVQNMEGANKRQIYEALIQTTKEVLAQKRYEFVNAAKKSESKVLYYMSMEFLVGRSLKNNLFNLKLEEEVRSYLAKYHFDLDEIYEMEPDAGLGNGGLGRLASCYMDALTTQNYPMFGFSILYEYGIFKQTIQNGWQVELPDEWLDLGKFTLLERSDEEVEIRFYGNTKEQWTDRGLKVLHSDYHTVIAEPYDLLISGYDSSAVNTLRLWSAKSKGGFNMPLFSQGEYSKSSEAEAIATSISKVLYPADDNLEGKELRIKQQYFFVSASLQQIVKKHYEHYRTLDNLHEKAAIHINDTHPSLCIPELMRILMDEYEYQWDQAWEITTKTCAYTNHTIMSEALEKWSVELIRRILPRVFTILMEINNRFIYEKSRIAGSDMNQMAVIHNDVVRMANLCIVGSHSVNGVSRLHSDIIKHETFSAFDRTYPNKFTNVTNGIAHRRWLLQANPELSAYVKELIGDRFIYDLNHLEKLLAYQNDETVLLELGKIKEKKKEQLARIVKERSGIILDTKSIFDVQVKRLHEYKRQLLNALHITNLYRRIIEEDLKLVPRTFLFAAKASAGYYMAKQIIRYICALADTINRDERARDRLKIVFMEDYNVSLAENIIPSADISEQISQAGKEASGTGNMKFMLNGAVTLGTMDGANVEIYEQVGEDNIFLFGMNAEEVLELEKQNYRSSEYYRNDEDIRAMIDFIKAGKIAGEEFVDMVNYLLHSDPYMNLADFKSYVSAQERVGETYVDKSKFHRMSLVNIAKSGIFSADRATKEYADHIWDLQSVTLSKN